MLDRKTRCSRDSYAAHLGSKMRAKVAEMFLFPQRHRPLEIPLVRVTQDSLPFYCSRSLVELGSLRGGRILNGAKLSYVGHL